MASRNSPEIDVYWSNELTHVAGKQQGLYEKLDPAVMTNLADVDDSAKDPDNIGVAQLRDGDRHPIQLEGVRGCRHPGAGRRGATSGIRG